MALTFRSVGSIAINADGSALAPGAPAGKAVGDLLLAHTGQRGVGAVLNSVAANWVPLAVGGTAGNGIATYARVADGTSADAFTADWSLADDSYAWVEAYSGYVYGGDLRSLVTNITTIIIATATTVSLPVLGISGSDRFVVLHANKNKSATSNDATTITAPAGYTKRAQTIGTGNSIVAASASLQQSGAAVDFDGSDFTIDGTSESTTACGIAIAIRTEASPISNIIPDALAEAVSVATVTPFDFQLAMASSGVRGVVVAITHGVSSTDHIGAGPVTIGGVAMTRVTRHTDTSTEPGASEIWFLGASIPQGNQTISIPIGSTTDIFHAVARSFLAPGDMHVIDSDGINENAANPSVTLQNGSEEAIAVASLYSGIGGLANFVENKDCVRSHDHLFGSFMSIVFRQVYSTTGDFTIGGTSVTDDVAYSAVSLGYTPDAVPSSGVFAGALTAEKIPQSVSKLVVFRAVLVGTEDAATGKTIPIKLSKNGGIFANPSVGSLNATEMEFGFYKFTLSTTDVNTKGPLIFRASEVSIADVVGLFTVVNATNADFTGIPDAVAGAAGGLPLSAAGSLNLDAMKATVDDIKQMIGHKTTIATLASQTSFTLTAGSADNDAYNGWGLFAIDSASSVQVCLGIVLDYVGASKTITLREDPAVFNMAVGDNVVLLPAKLTTSLLDEVIEGAVTLRQAARIWNAALAGKASGLAGTTATYRDIGDTKNRIVATVDSSGNRSAITLDAT